MSIVLVTFSSTRCVAQVALKKCSPICSHVSIAHKGSLQESSHVARCFVSRVCLVWSDFTVPRRTLHEKCLDPLSMPRGPLCHWMIKNDSSTPMSCVVLAHDVETSLQSSCSLLSSSVCVALLSGCHSCRQSPSSSGTLHSFTQALLLVAVQWHVSVACLQCLQIRSKASNFAPLQCMAFAKRFSP